MRPHGFLSGITVLALEHAVAAPFATRQLADLGARVIKIERPGSGDFARGYDTSIAGQSSYFVWLNRGKESVTLDVKSAAGGDILRQLLDRADVLVQNLGPGAAARLGLSAPALRESHPRLIACDISGYGPDGPWADRKAYDLLVQAEAGVLSLTGEPDTEAKVGISIADISAGMYALTGILTALYARDTGQGTAALDISLLDTLSEWMGQPALYAAGSGRQQPRTGAHHATIAPYGPHRTVDGEVLLAIQNDREWVRLCEQVLGGAIRSRDARFATNPDRVRHRDELTDIIERRFATLSTAAVEELLDTAQIAHARVNDVQGLLDHPVLAARERWCQVETPGGPVRMLKPPVTFSGPAAVAGVAAAASTGTPALPAVPAVGEHTDAVLRELGHAPADIAQLRSTGVI